MKPWASSPFWALVAVALAGGCKQPATTTTTAPAPAPATRRAEPPTAARATLDPPIVTYDAGAIDYATLPAIAADGSVVLLARQAPDGGRGNPNLTLSLVDRNDVHVKTLVVMTANDYDRLIDRPKVAAQRFALANAWIEKLHAAKQFTPIALEMSPGDACNCVELYGESRLVWKRDKLTVIVKGARVAELDTPASWHHTRAAGIRERCGNQASIVSGVIDLKHRLAIVSISFENSDLCWEPGTTEHVIGW